jgi:hypothetical protein
MESVMLKKMFAVTFVVTTMLLLVPGSFAADDQSIQFTLTDPAQLANKVLGPGKYYVRPVDSSLLNAVQVSRDDGKAVGFFLVHPELLSQPSAQSTIELDQQPGSTTARLTGFVVSGAQTGYDFSGETSRPPLRIASRIDNFFHRHV